MGVCASTETPGQLLPFRLKSCGHSVNVVVFSHSCYAVARELLFASFD